MAAISETLRQARLRSGVDLDRLAAKTKINPRYLEAIEKGDFDKLPSGIFARMFIKQYADAVGLDGATFAEEFQRSSQFGNYAAPELSVLADSRRHFNPTVPGISSGNQRIRDEKLTSVLSSLIWVVAAILVCAGAYYGLAHLPPLHSSSAATSTPAPAPAPAKTSEPVKSAPATPTAPAQNPSAASTSETSPSADPIQLTLNA